WLTCPNATKLVSRLESEQTIEKVRKLLKEHTGFRERFLFEEKRYSLFLNEMLTRYCPGDVARALSNRGVSGGRLGTLKCLHSHVAFAILGNFSTGVVGNICIERLGGVDNVWCRDKPSVCVG
ncbi:MAG: DUF501 domain-containing protein, partial [Actinomycetota bacterium]|nr:DUF501 domain-containing protein [Actinomycetota bacterium]